MNVNEINQRLAVGGTDDEGLLPHVEDLKRVPFRFDLDFGLQRLPLQEGVIAVRGARQYGKSTWLELQVLATVKEFGPGTAYYLNGDFIIDADALDQAIRDLVPLFRRDAPVRRLFIDEITAVKEWQRALKRLVDGAVLKEVLGGTTGSKAADLLQGNEPLP